MSRILKANTVTIDTEHKKTIDIGILSVLPEGSSSDELTDEPPEKKALTLLENAKREASALLADARKEAARASEEIKAQATAEAEKMKTEAHDTGYREGCEKATAMGEDIKARANKILADAKKEREDMIAALEPEMVSLIIQVTGKLLQDEVRVNPGVIINLIRQGIQGATLTGDIAIRVSAEDFAFVSEHQEEISAMTGGSIHMEIIQDGSLSKMDCVIETPFGNIDCGLDQQFNALSENLLHILQAGQKL